MSALEIGMPAPGFSFRDDGGRIRTLSEFTEPVVLVFGRSAHAERVQYLTIEGERLPVLSPPDEVEYGTPGQLAVFVVGRDGLNRKTATSQLVGGIVYGVSMALHEHTAIDPRNGRYLNADLSEYLVPVNREDGRPKNEN